MKSIKSYKSIGGVAILLGGLALTSTGNAASISASNSCPGGVGCDTGVSSPFPSYGFSMVIEQRTSDNTIFDLTLTNTSSTSTPLALIDAFAMNMGGGTLGTDFSVGGFTAPWTFGATGPGFFNGVNFTYVGDANSPGDRLAPNGMLSFWFDFTTNTSFDPWLTAGTDTGGGFGGGGDSGQLAVSFQQLGSGGQDSDLLAANWVNTPSNPPNPPNPASEPPVLMLMLSALAAMLFSRKKIA